MVIPGTIKTKTTETAALLVGMSPRAELDQLDVLNGRGISSLTREGAVIESDYAHEHHVAIGEYIDVTAFGFTGPLKIEGIGRTPDSLFASADPQYFVLQRGSLAYVFVPLKVAQRTAHALAGAHSAGADDLLMDFPPGRMETREQILTHGEPVNQIVPRRQQFGFRATKLNLSALASLTPVLTAVLSTVAVLLIAVTVMRLVQSQQRELGTMLALGHKRFSVVIAAVLPAMILGLLGAMLAIPVCVAVAKLVASQFSTSYGFLAVPTKLTAASAALAGGLAIGTTMIAVIFPATRLIRLSPSQAIRGATGTPHQLPAWLRSTTGMAGTAWAYGVRNVLRTPIRSTLTVLSLGGAIGLGIALHIVASSVQSANDNWFAQQTWTDTVLLQKPTLEPAALQIGNTAHARQVEPIVSGSIQLADRSGRLGEVDIVGTPPTPRLEAIGLPNESIKAGTTFASMQLMTQFGLHIGERLILTGPHKKLTTVIAGTANTLAEEDCYVPLATAQALLGQNNKITSLLVAGGTRTASILRKSVNVSKVVDKSTVKAGVDRIISQLKVLINVVMYIGLAVGALFLISSLAMSVLERQSEFAVLHALGWSKHEIATIVITESVVLTASGAIVASVLAPAIAAPLMHQISAAWFHISYDLRLTDFLVVIVPALVLAILVALQTSARVGRLDIARAVRARTTG
jgi:ABC-type antimicrobial peptide transport system permease subunit